jgi:hypothetical protein
MNAIKLIRLLLTTASMVILLTACNGGSSSTPGNQNPTVSLGADFTVDEQTVVSLVAMAADSDGQISHYDWQQTAGPAVNAVGTDTRSFTTPAVDTDTALAFTVTVTDDLGATASDSIVVTVQHVNRAPQILSMSVPAGSSGRIPVTIQHSDYEQDPLALVLEFSRDSGSSWHMASVAGQVGSGNTAATSGTTTVLWDSLADLGFRDPGTAMLRVSASDGVLTTAPLAITTHSIDNLKAAVDRIDNQAIYYGTLDNASIANLQQYQLVVLHPGSGNLDRSQVAAVQAGVDSNDPGDDVLVMCYLSIGEDIRTVGVDWATTTDPRFLGDGSGPRVDPRTSPYDGGLSLNGIDPAGIPSPGGTGFASYYLDDNSAANGAADGLPDTNATFGGAFVNMGDPAWYTVLNSMTLAADNAAGIAEILTLSTGRGLGCDGLFLDTVDTASPDSFTNQASPNQSEFEWTAAGFAVLTSRIKQDYPRTLLLQNRGLFYYDPRYAQYTVNARADIDMLLFESYRLNSSSVESYSTTFFPDNKYSITPKLMAEANRPDGFRVFSLGYAEGPPAEISSDTLLGIGSLGLGLLQDDISEAMAVGYRHYLTNGAIDLLNDFVLNNVNLADSQPPQWSSTYNDSVTFPPGPPTPRVGLQQLDAGGSSLTLHWDVALDQNAVRYVVYYQTQPFDFGAADPLVAATRVELSPAVGDGYTSGVGPGVYAYQARIEGLSGNDTYYVLLRAQDTSLAANEDSNQVVLSASLASTFVSITIDGDLSDWNSVPVALTDAADVADSNGPDWLDIRIANDNDYLYLNPSSENVFNLDGSPGGFSRLLIYIDADNDPGTGFTIAGMGADLLINNNSLYSMATGSTFSTTHITDLSVLPLVAITNMEWAIPLTEIRNLAPAADQIGLVFQNDEVLDFAPDTGHYNYTLQTP